MDSAKVIFCQRLNLSSIRCANLSVLEYRTPTACFEWMTAYSEVIPYFHVNGRGPEKRLPDNWAKSSSIEHARLCPFLQLSAMVRTSYRAHIRGLYGLPVSGCTAGHLTEAALPTRTSGGSQKLSDFERSRTAKPLSCGRPFSRRKQGNPLNLSQPRYTNNFLEKSFRYRRLIGTKNQFSLMLCGARINTSPTPLFLSMVKWNL